MSQEVDLLYEKIEQVRLAPSKEADRFPRNAHFFALDLVDDVFAVLEEKKSTAEVEDVNSYDLKDHVLPQYTEQCHVSTATLLSHVAECARERFGFMAELVFEYWRINRPEDLGEILFRLIDAKLLATSNQDSRKHFEVGLSMKELLAQRPYELKLKP